MAHKFFNKFWVTFTIILFGILFIVLFPMMIDKYGFMGAVMLSPLLVLAAFLAYVRGYWVSRWMSEGEDRNNNA